MRTAHRRHRRSQRNGSVRARGNFKRMDTTTHPLLTREILQRLHRREIDTLEVFLRADVKRLTEITSLTYKNITIIKKHILNKNAALVRTAHEYYKELLQKTAIVASGIKNLDNLLEGGFLTGNIYEICGHPASGKTKLCTSIILNQARDYERSVLYWNTTGDFLASRLMQHLKPDDNPQEILSKILVKQITNIHELINALYETKDGLIRNKLRFRVIVLDSLPALVYQHESAITGGAILNLTVNIMRLIAVEFHVVFIVTNLITTWREFDSGKRAVETVGCGKYWSTVPNTRLKVVKCKEVSVLKSAQLKEGTTVVLE